MALLVKNKRLEILNEPISSHIYILPCDLQSVVTELKCQTMMKEQAKCYRSDL